MTNIYIKGILGKKFGTFFKAKISSAISALKLIDANKYGFIDEIKNLNKKNINYTIICDGEILKTNHEFFQKKSIKNIYIIPYIIGFGEAVAVGMGLVIAETGKLTLTGAIVAGAVNAVIASAISLGVSFLMSSINSQTSPQLNRQQIAVGGATSTIESKGKSYIFSNSNNAVSQGASVPVGYGTMIIGSRLISASIKNYSTDQIFFDQIKYNPTIDF